MCHIFGFLVALQFVSKEEVDQITLSRLESNITGKLVDPKLLYNLEEVCFFTKLLLGIFPQEVFFLVLYTAAKAA